MISVLKNREAIQDVLRLFSDRLGSLRQGEKYIADMAEKFSRYAEFLVMTENDDVIAFSAFYCNDTVSGKAFLSMIAVSSGGEGKGHGTVMLNEVLNVCAERGMKVLMLEVGKANVRAVDFYKRNGFSFAEKQTERSFFMEKSI